MARSNTKHREGPDVPAHAGADGLCAWSWSGALGSTVTLDLLVLEAN